MFLNKNGKWVNREIGNNYDNFLTEEYYVYEKIDK